MELKTLHTNDNDIFVGFAESRIGGRPENQDSYGFKETKLGFLLTVCDGMGGGPGGKTASTIAVTEIIAGVEESNEDEEVANILIKAVRRANMAILEAGNQNPPLQGMGSTATVLLLSEKSAYIAYVGDSRVYQIRGGKKAFRTFDHSMVFELVKQKVITEEQARLSAQSNVITRALGMKPDLEVDVLERSYDKGDRFVLCSDGIHGSMPEKELLKLIANRRSSLGAVVDDIATYVDNLGRSNGGHHDNLTLAIIETKINSKLKEKMSRLAKNLILALSILCVASVALNFYQGCNARSSSCPVDSTATKQQKTQVLQKDSTIKAPQDSIKQLNKKQENQ
jgi:protein phosphatase